MRAVRCGAVRCGAMGGSATKDSQQWRRNTQGRRLDKGEKNKGKRTRMIGAAPRRAIGGCVKEDLRKLQINRQGMKLRGCLHGSEAARRSDVVGASRYLPMTGASRKAVAEYGATTRCM